MILEKDRECLEQVVQPVSMSKCAASTLLIHEFGNDIINIV